MFAAKNVYVSSLIQGIEGPIAENVQQMKKVHDLDISLLLKFCVHERSFTLIPINARISHIIDLEVYSQAT